MRTPARRMPRMPNSAARNSWNGARNVYSNVSGTTLPASSADFTRWMQRIPGPATRSSWKGARNVYSNVSGTTSPASSENECWFLGELVAARTQKVSILAFSSSFGEKQENELSRTSKSIEAKKYLDFGNFRPVSVKTRKRARWHSRPVEVQNK